MSVRIYQLSKLLEMENKEVITLLQKKGLKVESPSNTIPNIYADSILEEYGKPPFDEKSIPTEEKKKSSVKKTASKDAKKVDTETLEPSEETPISSQEAKITKAPGKVVKTAQDLVEEKTHLTSSPTEGPVKNTPILSTAASSKTSIKQETAPSTILASSPVLKDQQSVTSPKIPPKPVLYAPLPTTEPTVKSNVSIHVAPSSRPTFPSVPQTPQVPSLKTPIAAPALHKSPSAPTLPPRIPASMASSPAIQEEESSIILASSEIIESIKGDKIVACKPPIVVRDFALLLDLKPFRLISELMEMGIFASMNQIIDEETAVKVAKKHGFTLEIRHRGEQQQAETQKKKPVEPVKEDETQFLEPRPPVVCVLGHVDHGKTSLLDAIRKTNVVSGEAGGITQHIGAYQVEHNNHKITFIDTPGHAAFSKMRERGANITDIAVLVVAADDGFMPQTDEALKFAQKANVPIVVAINKKDAKGANIERVKQQMQQRNIASEDWGGETLVTPVSAIKNEGISELLDLILLQTEIMELKANPKCGAEGTIIEAQMEQGRGPTASIIVTRGTLKLGDALVCGPYFCKVKAMVDDCGTNVKMAPPSTPVKLIGWSDTPEAGMKFFTAKNDRDAKREAEENTDRLKKESQTLELSKKQPANIEELFAAIKDSQKKVFKVIIKADVHGTSEALEACLKDIKSSKVDLEVVGTDVGGISKNDIILADASKAAIIAFNVKSDQGVTAIAKHHNVRIITHNIIYELITQVKESMAELLDPEIKEVKVGAAEVRQVFTLSKGTVAGCMVTEGKIIRDAFARVLRGNQVLHTGKFSALRRFKEDSSEVRAGYECGISVEGFNAYQPKDTIECFQIEKIKPSL